MAQVIQEDTQVDMAERSGIALMDRKEAVAAE